MGVRKKSLLTKTMTEVGYAPFSDPPSIIARFTKLTGMQDMEGRELAVVLDGNMIAKIIGSVPALAFENDTESLRALNRVMTFFQNWKDHAK